MCVGDCFYCYNRLMLQQRDLQDCTANTTKAKLGYKSLVVTACALIAKSRLLDTELHQISMQNSIMIVKGFILFALLVCIAESAPMDAMTRRDMSLLKQLLQVAQLQQEEGGAPVAPSYKQNTEEDEGNGDMSIKMMKGLLQAQVEEMTDKDLRDILDNSNTASVQWWRSIVRHFFG